MDNWETWFKNPDNVDLYQFMAKDNIPFHSILFPASLIGTGESYTLFKHINATEYLMFGGEKFSKTNGVGIFGNHLIESTISRDIWRIYLLWIRPEKADSSFSMEHFKTFNNTELLANIGNYINRNVNLFNKLETSDTFKLDLSTEDFMLITSEITTLLTQYHKQMIDVNISSALRTVFEISALANKFLTQREPWKKVMLNLKRQLYYLVLMLLDY